MLPAALACASASAQTHAVAKPEQVVRALAVYEWTGDLPKPAASRLVPVSVFINGQLQDAGVYLARPIPFALGSGTVFEVERAGVDQGSIELSFARHVQTPEPSVDDGWFAYGAFKPKPAPPVYTAKSGPLTPITVTSGNGPHFGTKPDASSSTATTPVDRSGAAGAGTTVSASPADSSDSRTKDPLSDSAKDDPDRPTLKKRTQPEISAGHKKAQQASVTSAGSLNDDPDRPNLHRGKPDSRLDDEDLPALKGIPAGMHQQVAVSDAKDRAEHSFTRPWESDADKPKSAPSSSR